jgi:hypothetical protein
MISLRRILAITLVLLATIPALLVATLLARAASASVEELAGTVLAQVASRVQGGTESRLRQAHDVLNGVGATALHVDAGALEDLARQGWPADAAGRHARLHQLWDQTRAALDAWG